MRKLKERIHRLYKQKQKPIVVALALLLLGSVGYAVAKIYWSRTVTYEFGVVGIEAELLEPTPSGCKNKVITTTLTTDKKIALSIMKENFYVIWCNLTWTSTAQGLRVTASGQYNYFVQREWGLVFEPSGAAFDIMGYHTVDKNLMLWTNSYALVITFTFDTELVTSPGQYNCNLLFQLGFI